MKRITKREADKLVRQNKKNPWFTPVVLCVNNVWYDIRGLKDPEILEELKDLHLTYLQGRRAD